MAEKQSVVTKERFASGLTFPDFLGQIKVNKDRFNEFYQSGQLTADDQAFFQEAVKMPNGPAKILVLGEDWCPDVFRGLPVFARIAEASGMELRVFFRDQNLDIMNEFLNQGQFQSIPTVVFYTKDHEYMFHWSERPQAANRERADIEAQVRKEKPGATDQEIRPLVGERSRTRYPAWQQETIREIRQIIAQKLGI